jgi:NAD(P) transhydrogenase subunit alpha
MKIAVLRERAHLEARVAITPDIVKSYKSLGFEIYIENDAGLAADYTNEQYEAAGAKISKILLEILADADIILKVQPTPLTEMVELEYAKEEALMIGLMSPYDNKKYFEKAASKKLNIFAMELIPRISRAQSIDVLSSQSNLAGYRAVIDAAYHYKRIFPMLMTAAGTIVPAKVLILGAGVAGLQAVATAKRLGAVVSVFDVRSAVKEQVESLGANFIEVPTDHNMETKSGYAKEVSQEYKDRQQNLIEQEIAKSDIVITTALIPGKKAPVLVTQPMVEKMKYGSVIIDLAAISCGNCELTKLGEVVLYKGVKIIGSENILSNAANDASKMYAKNLFNFIKLIFDENEKQIKLNMQDEIILSSLVTANGKIVNSKLLEIYNAE